MQKRPLSTETMLRSGYTTGACAAAAAKGAAEYLLSDKAPEEVALHFPDGSLHRFVLHSCSKTDERVAVSSVIKDAGDDPDVTNGAIIQAEVAILHINEIAAHRTAVMHEGIWIAAGKGVGRVTRPGLPVEPGDPAINPVPRKMIHDAVAWLSGSYLFKPERDGLLVTVSIPDGQRLAEKTLNKRLGIVEGLSVLGTTGIVRPVSADAWTATIETSMSVARCAGFDEIILSTGRTSERAVMNLLGMPEEACAMMGDYLEFSLLAASRYDFSKIHLAAMWAKIVKAAMEVPQTHIRHGAVDVDAAVRFLASRGVDVEVCEGLAGSNTVREIYYRLEKAGRMDVIRSVCRMAGNYARRVSGLETVVYLVKKSDHVAEVV